jgi:hypothetical protein
MQILNNIYTGKKIMQLSEQEIIRRESLAKI